MKIKRIERVKTGKRLVGYAKFGDSEVEQPMHEPFEISRERFSMFDGIIVQDFGQIQELLNSKVPPNTELMLVPDRKEMISGLAPGKAFSIPTHLTYSELFVWESSDEDDEPPGPGEFSYNWEVELEFDAATRKEQVSLTLSASTLVLLRAQAMKTKQSLSAVVDSRLQLALGMQGADYGDEYRQLVGRLESLVNDAKGIYKPSSEVVPDTPIPKTRTAKKKK